MPKRLWKWLAALVVWMFAGAAVADTPIALLESYAGYVDFVGTEKTLRSQSNNGNACAVNTSNSATLSGIPAGATIQKAYLYWAGSGQTPDYTVTFDGTSYTATRQYTATSPSGNPYFSGVADVTAKVAAKGNASYTFSGLSVASADSGSYDWCSVSAVLSGWSLLVIYSQTSGTYRVLNLYEGFQAFQYDQVTLSLSNFQIPNPIGTSTARIAHITWEGDPDLLDTQTEHLRFNGTNLTDVNNPDGNQFNSISTISGTADTTSYGVDFDAYTVSSPVIKGGDTSATTIYESGQDMVLLSAEVVAVPNVPVADLAITMTESGAMKRGNTVTYTLNMSNNGPSAETGPVTVVDTLPTGLTFVSASGNGWTCNAVGQVVTCTRSGALAVGASTNSITVTATVNATATGTITNTATVDGPLFDNVASNSTATDSQVVQSSDLSVDLVRSAALTPGQSATYTLTVSNGGVLPDTNVQVVDTLPTGLSYSSASGTGWTCSAVGQVVTCTYGGTVAAGATLSTITLNVTVSAGASGTITNTATVSGTEYDSNTANNTDSDAYSFGFVLYAYYALDDTSWASSVVDGSGNTRDGTLISGTTATPTGYDTTTPKPPNPPAGAITGNPGTCGAGKFPAQSGPSGVNTGVDVDAIGSAGTIMFWYSSNAAWNDGNNRMLIDASSNLGGSGSDKNFYVVKETDGRIRFVLENSNDTDYEAVSSGFSYAANTWHHIAITWDFGSNKRMRVYVDASLKDETGFGWWDSVANWSTLAIGGQRTSGVQGTGGTYTANSANGYIDEVRIYNSELTAAQITTAKAYTHSCGGVVDHYELWLPTASVSCASSAVTVVACKDSTSPCTNKATSASGATATLATSAGSLGSTSVTIDSTGQAVTTLSYSSAADGATAAVTLSGESMPATYSRKCCPDSTNCTTGNSCSTTFKTTGFIFSSAADGTSATIPTQVAGTTSSTYYLRAVKTGTSTKACEAALTGTTTVQLAVECVDPTSCTSSTGPTCGGSTGYFCLTPYNGVTAQTSVPIGGNNSGNVSSYTNVSLVFDANGNAPFTFNYRDAGKLTLYAKKTASGTLLTTLTGSTNTFVVKPYALVLSGIKCTTANSANCGAGALAMPTAGDNPGATNATGVSFIRAGDPFSVTVTATANGGAATPNFGKESSPDWIALTPTLVAGLGLTANPTLGRSTSGTIAASSATLTVASTTGFATGDRVRVAGAGASGADLVATIAAIPSATTLTLGTAASTAVSGAAVTYTFPTFSNGAATGSNFTWGETGIITLTPSIGDSDYLGAGAVTGTVSGNVGRFFPHHFSAAGTLLTRSDLFAHTTGSMAAGAAVLTVASANGIAAGNSVVVLGAGVDGVPLQTTVTAVAGTNLTLAGSATTAVAGATVYAYNAQDAFTYMAEPMLLLSTVTARNASDSVTTNYRTSATAANNFAKLDTASITAANWLNVGCATGTQCFGLGAINGAVTPLTARLAVDASVAAAEGNWSNGIGSFATHLTLSRPATTTADGTWGPYATLNIGIAPQDSDGTVVPAAGSSDTHKVTLDADANGTAERVPVATTAVRFGRLRLMNAYGSELLPIQIPVRAEYYGGTSWLTNPVDNLTPLSTASVALGNLVAGTGSNLALAVPPAGLACTPATCRISSGASTLTLTPTARGSGWFDMVLNLGSGTTAGTNNCLAALNGGVGGTVPSPALNYLLANWCGAAADRAPNARIKFGATKAPFIYLRERY